MIPLDDKELGTLMAMLKNFKVSGKVPASHVELYFKLKKYHRENLSFDRMARGVATPEDYRVLTVPRGLFGSKIARR